MAVHSFGREDGLPSNTVWDVKRDRSGRLWFATAGGLCLFSEGKGCRTFTVADGLPVNQALHLFEARDGALWVCTRGGVARVVDRDGEPRVESFADERAGVGQECYAIDQLPVRCRVILSG